MALTNRMNTMDWTAALVLLALLMWSVSAWAGEPRFEIIGDGVATDISADGSVIVGRGENTRDIWRWSRESGRVLLGQGAASGWDPGTPDVSSDGKVVSATLDHREASGGTPGIWQEESGWNRPLSTGRTVVWGMSDDAETLVGLAWDESGPDGVARAVSLNQEQGMVLLGEPGRNSRANDASMNGKVIVGWSQNLGTGTWQPVAWTGDGTTVLATTRAFCEATAVSPDGTIIVGQSFDEFLNQRGAALWLASDFGWVQEDLGTLPGTFANFGQAVALDLSADGRVIVGLNRFDWDRSTGFVWTPNDGMQDIKDYLVGQGIATPADFTIDAVTAISDDGRVIAGHGRSGETWPRSTRSFLALISGEGGALAGPSSNSTLGDPDDPLGLNPFRFKNQDQLGDPD